MSFIYYSETVRTRAIHLRKEGKSYSEIKRILKIRSKGTLSVWFRKLELTSEERKRLGKNMLLAQERGLLEFNRKRTESIKRENQKNFQEASALISPLSKKELLLVGVALYWGEGTKSPYRSNYSLAFSNSDSKMVALFMRFVREILSVPDSWIGGGINGYPHTDEKKAREFWAQIVKIPPKKFYFTRRISSASRLKRPKNLLPFGTVSVRIHKRLLFQKVMGYINGLTKQVQ